MTRKNLLLAACIAAIASICLDAVTASPQAIPPPPPPNLSLVPPVDMGAVATIGFANSTSVRTIALPAGELPLPTPTPPAVIDLRPSATFTFADGARIKAERNDSRRFPLVGLHQKEVIDIALEFPASLTSISIKAQPLDGGKIIALSNISKEAAVIRFQVANQPGLYRILVPGLSGSALLQFWVIDPNNPKAKPPVLNPGH